MAAATAPAARPPVAYRVGQRSKFSRRWVPVDTDRKSVSNLAWVDLPAHARAAHDEIERWCGRFLTRGRVRLARKFRNADWRRLFLTTIRTVEILIAAGWCAWDGDDLRVLGTDLGGEKRYRDRSAQKSLQQRLRWLEHKNRVAAELSRASAAHEKIEKSIQVPEKTPRQVAEPRHFDDADPAPAPAPAPAITDLIPPPVRIPSAREAKKPPPPPL